MAGSVDPAPSPQPPTTATLGEQIEEGQAIFSTRSGRVEKQIAHPMHVSIVLRDDPVGDCIKLAANLRMSYPNECNTIFGPVDHVYRYFDHKDVHIHGAEVLKCVLHQIAVENQHRARTIVNFAETWKQSHPDRLKEHLKDYRNLNVFDKEDHQKYGQQFLFDALCYLNPALRSFARGEPAKAFLDPQILQSRTTALAQHDNYSTETALFPEHDQSPASAEADFRRSTPLSLPLLDTPPIREFPEQPPPHDNVSKGRARGRSATIAKIGLESRTKALDDPSLSFKKVEDPIKSVETRISRRTDEKVRTATETRNLSSTLVSPVAGQTDIPRSDYVAPKKSQSTIHASASNRPQPPTTGQQTLSETQHGPSQSYVSVQGDYLLEKGNFRGKPYGQRQIREKSRGNQHAHGSPYSGDLSLTPTVQAVPVSAPVTIRNQIQQPHGIPIGISPLIAQPAMVPGLYGPGAFGPVSVPAQQAAQGLLRSDDPMFAYVRQISPHVLGAPSPGIVPYVKAHDHGRDVGNFPVLAPGSHTQAMPGPIPSFAEPGLAQFPGVFHQPSPRPRRSLPPSRDGPTRSHPRKSFTDDARVLQNLGANGREYNAERPRHQRSLSSYSFRDDPHQNGPPRSQRSSGMQHEQMQLPSPKFMGSLEHPDHRGSEYIGYVMKSVDEHGEASTTAKAFKGKHPSAEVSDESFPRSMNPSMDPGALAFESMRGLDSVDDTTEQRNYSTRRPSFTKRNACLDYSKLFISGYNLTQQGVHEMCAPFRPEDISQLKLDPRNSQDEYGFCFAGFRDPGIALKAMQTLRTFVNDRGEPLRVNYARQRFFREPHPEDFDQPRQFARADDAQVVDSPPGNQLRQGGYGQLNHPYSPTKVPEIQTPKRNNKQASGKVDPNNGEPKTPTPRRGKGGKGKHFKGSTPTGRQHPDSFENLSSTQAPVSTSPEKQSVEPHNARKDKTASKGTTKISKATESNSQLTSQEVCHQNLYDEKNVIVQNMGEGRDSAHVNPVTSKVDETCVSGTIMQSQTASSRGHEITIDHDHSSATNQARAKSIEPGLAVSNPGPDGSETNSDSQSQAGLSGNSVPSNDQVVEDKGTVLFNHMLAESTTVAHKLSTTQDSRSSPQTSASTETPLKSEVVTSDAVRKLPIVSKRQPKDKSNTIVRKYATIRPAVPLKFLRQPPSKRSASSSEAEQSSVSTSSSTILPNIQQSRDVSHRKRPPILNQTSRSSANEEAKAGSSGHKEMPLVVSPALQPLRSQKAELPSSQALPSSLGSTFQSLDGALSSVQGTVISSTEVAPDETKAISQSPHPSSPTTPRQNSTKDTQQLTSRSVPAPLTKQRVSTFASLPQLEEDSKVQSNNKELPQVETSEATGSSPPPKTHVKADELADPSTRVGSGKTKVGVPSLESSPPVPTHKKKKSRFPSNRKQSEGSESIGSGSIIQSPSREDPQKATPARETTEPECSRIERNSEADVQPAKPVFNNETSKAADHPEAKGAIESGKTNSNDQPESGIRADTDATVVEQSHHPYAKPDEVPATASGNGEGSGTIGTHRKTKRKSKKKKKQKDESVDDQMVSATAKTTAASENQAATVLVDMSRSSPSTSQASTPLPLDALRITLDPSLEKEGSAQGSTVPATQGPPPPYEPSSHQRKFSLAPANDYRSQIDHLAQTIGMRPQDIVVYVDTSQSPRSQPQIFAAISPQEPGRPKVPSPDLSSSSQKPEKYEQHKGENKSSTEEALQEIAQIIQDFNKNNEKELSSEEGPSLSNDPKPGTWEASKLDDYSLDTRRVEHHQRSGSHVSPRESDLQTAPKEDSKDDGKGTSIEGVARDEVVQLDVKGINKGIISVESSQRDSEEPLTKGNNDLEAKEPNQQGTSHRKTPLVDEDTAEDKNTPSKEPIANKKEPEKQSEDLGLGIRIEDKDEAWPSLKPRTASSSSLGGASTSSAGPTSTGPVRPTIKKKFSEVAAEHQAKGSHASQATSDAVNKDADAQSSATSGSLVSGLGTTGQRRWSTVPARARRGSSRKTVIDRESEDTCNVWALPRGEEVWEKAGKENEKRGREKEGGKGG